jgi:hypothetical protein
MDAVGGAGEGGRINVDVVHVVVVVAGIGERGEDGGGVVKDVAGVEERDGSGGHVWCEEGGEGRRGWGRE